MDQGPLHPPEEVATVSNDGQLQTHIQARIAAGKLPRIDGHALAGISQGQHLCVCCHELIRAAAPVYAPREHPDLFAHLACFDLWNASGLTASDEAAVVKKPSRTS